MNGKVDRSVSQQLWPALMVDVVQSKYSESKENRKTLCGNRTNAQGYSECLEQQDTRMRQIMFSMEYFSTKYNTCLQEGRYHHYSDMDVRRFCKETIYAAAKLL